LGRSVNDLARRAGITPRALRDVSCRTAPSGTNPSAPPAPLSRLDSPQAILEFFLEGQRIATGDAGGSKAMPRT
jgi:hypothetical protein